MNYLKDLKAFIAPKTSNKIGAINNFNGFVIVSFGTILNTAEVPLWAYEKLLEAIDGFPELNFVVKFKMGENGAADELFKKRSNVLTMNWLPQAALLGSFNYKYTYLIWVVLVDLATRRKFV